MENDKKPINTNIQNYKLTCNIFEKLKPSYAVLIYHSDSRKIANQVFSMLLKFAKSIKQNRNTGGKDIRNHPQIP